MMAARTPNLGRLAAEGMRFTDYYAGRSDVGRPRLLVADSVPRR